jgi:hypothetical protein
MEMQTTDFFVTYPEIQPKVYEVFQLLGFAQFFNIKSTADEAIAYFNNGGSNSDSSVFPVVISCLVCNKKLRATKSGRFRCSGCRSILAINENGEVSLG